MLGFPESYSPLEFELEEQICTSICHYNDPELGKTGRSSRDEIVRQHHQLSGHEFDQTLGDNEGQGSLACCSPWSCKESDMT